MLPEYGIKNRRFVRLEMCAIGNDIRLYEFCPNSLLTSGTPTTLTAEQNFVQ